VYVVKALVNYFTDKRNCKHKVAMEQGAYKLTEVKKAHRNHGDYRLISEKEKDKMIEWIVAFSNEVRMPMSEEEGRERVNRFLEKKQLYGLEIDGEIVSICAAVRPTRLTLTISFVYTPPVYRKKGYASDIVAYVTALKLNSGYKNTALYTDLTNPTSNKIYQEIGYEQVMNSIVIHLKD
ncbi:MAG: GNAT family N-acetyltransferase, partial [Bacillaceae bacterium]